MDFILNPFVTTLTFLYSILNGNIVLAIVLFTILIRLVTYPLTIQQQRTTKATQKIQPELKKLQEKYKNDREKLAQAQMELYKQYGVNPLGGCLPLVIQFPILIGLYQAIIHSLAATPLQLLDLSGRLLIPGLDKLIPLNNTWLGLDLTQPPAGGGIVQFAFPILVVITTWLQFKMTMPSTPKPAPGEKPAKADQSQAMTQSMGTVMPLMYGFFALNFSVGLSIYFIVSNLIGIAQYGLIGKIDWKNLSGRFGGGGGGSASSNGGTPSLMESNSDTASDTKPKRQKNKPTPKLKERS
jgi:YidC/Oxa1 family membrane protein insertase